MREHNIETQLIHAGEPSPRIAGSVITPIFQSATYAFRGDDDETLRYLRYSNAPNHVVLHRKLAVLEATEDALVFASGMAAISTALLAHLGAGDHVLVQDTLYGGTVAFLDEDLTRLGVTVERFDPVHVDQLEARVRPNTRVIYTEALSNPLNRIPDHTAILEVARRHNVVTMIDSTFATPINFQPATLGYDLVLHSATKYLNGHSDLVAGAVVGTREALAPVHACAKHTGGSLDAHACFLLERGLKTLALRVAYQNQSATKLAHFLAARAEVHSVHYPGLEDHPDHARGQDLYRGFGGVLAFDLVGGGPAAAQVLEHLELAVVAPSLGGVETLVSRPMMTSHANLTRAARKALGIVDGQVRVAIGIEHTDDVIADLAQALDRLA